MNIHKILFMANLFIIFIANFPCTASPLNRMQHSHCVRVRKNSVKWTYKRERKKWVFRVHLIFLFAVKIICIYILICFIVQSKWNFSCQFVFVSSCQIEMNNNNTITVEITFKRKKKLNKNSE